MGAVAFAFLVGGISGSAQEWPQLKGNSGFSGISQDDSIRPPLKLLWSYRLDGDASGDAGAGVIVAGGLVFASVANTHSIVALDAETGHFRWEYHSPEIGSIGYLGHAPVPAYEDGTLILWDKRNSSGVTALDAKTGEVRWRKSLRPEGKDPSRGGLPLANGLAYAVEGGPETVVTAFRIDDGERAWQSKLEPGYGEYTIGPTVAGGRLFVSTRANTRRGPKPDEFKGAITALDAVTGDFLWRRENVYSWSPMASDGKVLVCPMWSSMDDRIHLLDCATGKTIWSEERADNHFNPPITLTEDLVLYQPWGPKLHALSRRDGSHAWTFFNEFTSAGCCTPVISGRFAYLGTSVPKKSGDLESLRGFRLADTPSESGKYGTVNAIDLANGESVWRFPTTNTVCGDPALAYGRLYFASRDGRVYCCVPCGEGEPITPEARNQSDPASKAEIARLLEMAGAAGGKNGWPMEGGGPERAGREEAKLQLPLEPAWKVDTGGRVLTSAAMDGGRVYSGSESGKLLAIERESGEPAWEFDTGAPIRCSPAVAGDLVYAGSDSGTFHAIDRESGKPAWRFEAGGPVQASPAISGGVVVFGANDHHLYALDRFTGKLLWKFRTSRFCVKAPPVIHGGRVYAAGWSDWAWCLDLQTGEALWKSFIPVSIEAISWYRDRLWVRSPYYVVELDPGDGSWRHIAETSYGYGGMAFLGDRLFQSGVLGQYGTFGATSVAIDQEGNPPPEQVAPTLLGVKMLTPEPIGEVAERNAEGGDSLYSARMAAGMKKLPGSPELASMSAPLGLGDKLGFATLGGEIRITDADGKPLWKYSLGASSHGIPVAAGGLLVVGCDDGFLYAFRGSPGAD